MAKLSICNGVYLPGICSFYSVLLFPLIDNQPFLSALQCPCILFFFWVGYFRPFGLDSHVKSRWNGSVPSPCLVMNVAGYPSA